MNFNLNEIFEAAKQIERSGYKFYKEAAKRIPEHQEFLNFLANEEVGHEHIFNELQVKSVNKDFSDSIWNPDDIMTQYFESMTNSVVFNKGESSIDDLIKNSSDIMSVIDWALRREQDSVLYFTGLREALKDSEEKSKIDDIISEEIKHIHILMDKKSKLI